jgi:sortase A
VAAPVVAGWGGNALAGRWSAAVVASGECLAGPAPEAGEAVPAGCVGLLRIPRFGTDWIQPIQAGDGVGTLWKGVGWVADTTPPGQLGNFVLTGNHLGGGQPFLHLGDLDAGDRIEVETASHVYTYVVDVAPRDLTVGRRAAWVLDPVPGGEDVAPQTALLTLVTAQDFLPTGDRSVGVAVLAETQGK